MDKKKILIFLTLGIGAICCAFLIVKSFSSSSSSIKEEKTKSYSQDFIDVDTYQIDNKKDTDEVNVDVESNLEESNVSIDISEDDSTNVDVDNLSAYEQYLIDAEEKGFYDLSDIENNVLTNYEDTLNEQKEFSEEEILFFNNLKTLADNYTAAYEESLSYVFSSDLTSLEKYINNEYKKTIEDFSNIDTLGNKDFEEIKSDYYNGMLESQKGFNAYIKNPGTEDCNEYFLNSDKYFYNGQEKLETLLDSYK